MNSAPIMIVHTTYFPSRSDTTRSIIQMHHWQKTAMGAHVSSGYSLNLPNMKQSEMFTE